jgi:hypothetical protein
LEVITKDAPVTIYSFEMTFNSSKVDVYFSGKNGVSIDQMRASNM